MEKNRAKKKELPLLDFIRIPISSDLCVSLGDWEAEGIGHLQESISQRLHYHFKAGLHWKRLGQHRSPTEDENVCRDSGRRPLSSVGFPSAISPLPLFTVARPSFLIYLVLPTLSLPFPSFEIFPPGAYQYLERLAAWMNGPARELPFPFWLNFSIFCGL